MQKHRHRIGNDIPSDVVARTVTRWTDVLMSALDGAHDICTRNYRCRNASQRAKLRFSLYIFDAPCLKDKVPVFQCDGTELGWTKLQSHTT